MLFLKERGEVWEVDLQIQNDIWQASHSLTWIISLYIGAGGEIREGGNHIT